jgi:hypothetical protein
MSKTTFVFLSMCLFTMTCFSGCSENGRGRGVDAQLVSQHRAHLVMEVEPDEIMGITELRERLEGTSDTITESQATHDGDHDAAEERDAADDHDGQYDHDGQDGDDRHDDQQRPGDTGQEGVAESQHSEAEHEHAEPNEADHEQVDGSVAQQAGLGSMDDISVVGRISKETADGGASASDFPWEKGEAAFVMVDPAALGGEEEHQHAEGEECPFCAKKKIEAQAVVQFTAGGGTIHVDARDLFDLKVDDIVVVRGDAALQGGVLIIDAKGIYVRR